MYRLYIILFSLFLGLSVSAQSVLEVNQSAEIPAIPVTITLVRLQEVGSNNMFNNPSDGNRFVAALIKIDASRAGSGSMSIQANSQQSIFEMRDVSGFRMPIVMMQPKEPNFEKEYSLDAGDVGSGYVTFEVPVDISLSDLRIRYLTTDTHTSWIEASNRSSAIKSISFLDLAKTGTLQDIKNAISAAMKVNWQDINGISPLMSAAGSNKDVDVIKMLLMIGADVNAQSSNGLTALMFAANQNVNPDIVLTLLKAGADAKKKDADGNTAYDWAQSNESLKGTSALVQLKDGSK